MTHLVSYSPTEFLSRMQEIDKFSSQLQAVCLNPVAHVDPKEGEMSMIMLTYTEAKSFFLNVYNALLIDGLANQR